MGRDKATLPFDGVPMGARVADALRRGGCDPVVAVGGSESTLEALGLEVVPDLVVGIGPIGGLAAALARFPQHAAVVAMACDLPLLTHGTVTALVRGLTVGIDVAVAVTDRREPLCAAWRVGMAPLVESAAAAGERRIWKVLEGASVAEVPVEAAQLRNMNSPDDLNG
jgi:molybdopterin-guanine dinucleotide biosynthesis protein A